MKRPSFILLFAMLAMACSNDDDAPGADGFDSEDLVGTWDMTKNESTNVNATVTYQGQNFDLNPTYVSENIDYQVEFNEDGTVVPSGSFDVVLSISFLGMTETQTIPFDAGADGNAFLSGNYLLEDDTLFITNTATNTVLEAKVLSATMEKLVLELNLADVAFLDTSDLIPGATVSDISGSALVELER